jgi:4-amino-4-deoxy-L-arabinose transferase-like glycosyltransferase
VTRRGPARVALAVLGIAALILSVHFELTVRRPDRARLTFDSAEYAVAGRTWARTGRPGTVFVLPHESRVPAQPPFPLILGHPLVPALDAFAFRFVGVRSEATLGPPAVAYLALVGLSLALARALGASGATAVTAALGVALAPRVLYFASEGLTELPFAVALLALLWLLARERPPRPGAFGVLLGVAHLARPVLVPLLPVLLAGFAARRTPGTRTRGVLWTLAAFAPFAAVLALYKWNATGDPLADVARYNLLVGLEPRWTPWMVQSAVDPPSPWPMLLSHLPAVGRKLERALPDLGLGLFAQAGTLGAVAAAALVVGLARRGRRLVPAVVAGLAVTMIVLVALTLPSRRYLAPLLPALVVLAVVAIADWGRALRLPGWAATALAAVAVALTLGRDTARDWRWAAMRPTPDRGVFHESEWQAAGARLRATLPPGTMVASDAGAFVAWYADRPAALLPATPAQLDTLRARLPIAAVVLTNEWLLEQPGFETWRTIADDPSRLPGWSAASIVRAGRLRAVVLAPDDALR